MKTLCIFMAITLSLYGCSELPSRAEQEQITNAPGGALRKEVSASTTEVFKFIAKDHFGNVFWQNGNVAGSVFIFKGGNIQNPQTFLSYFVFDVNTFTVLEEGFGLIPNDDFQGSGTGGTLKLNTNTSAGANPGFTRSVGSGGVVAVEWNKTSLFSSHSTGSSQFRSGSTFRSHFSGTFDSSSASAQGSVVGFVIGVNVFAEMGKSHSASITIVK